MELPTLECLLMGDLISVVTRITMGLPWRIDMSFSNNTVPSILSVVVTLAFLSEPASTRSVACDDNNKRTAEPPTHFILNPDRERPPGYPAEISLEQVESFLKNQRKRAQGCGQMTWEGKACGMFCNSYAEAKTPWLKDQVASLAIFARTETGTFLADVMLGRNKYSRDDRTKERLIWTHNYEPEHEQKAIWQVLFGDDSARRKTLLIKIKKSFHNLDLAQFPAKRKELLSLQLQQCENDRDSTVVKLAREIRKALAVSDSPP
jgi:hypothetical protein